MYTRNCALQHSGDLSCVCSTTELKELFILNHYATTSPPQICPLFVANVTLQASLSGTFRPNSAIIGYTIEGALLMSAHLSTEIALKAHADSTIRKSCGKFGY